MRVLGLIPDSEGAGRSLGNFQPEVRGHGERKEKQRKEIITRRRMKGMGRKNVID